MEDADHVLDLVGIGILPTKCLRAEDFTLAHGIVPIEVIILFDVALLPGRALLNGTNTETSRQTVTPPILDGHGVLQRAAPAEALFAVVRGGVVHGHVDLDHAGVFLEA